MSADQLRHAVVAFFESLRTPSRVAPRASPHYANLVSAASTGARGTDWGDHACRQLTVIEHGSVSVRHLDGSRTNFHGEGLWTLEVDDARINSIVGDMSFPRPLDDVYASLYRIFSEARRYYVLNDKNSEVFYLWLRGHYQSWAEVAENCSRSADEPVPYDELSLPFFFPWLRFDGEALARLVRNIVRRVLGDQASMLTVVEDGNETPLIFYEQVEGGLFRDCRLYKGETLEQVRSFLADSGLPLAYTKRVPIACLRGIWEAEKAFLMDGQRELHTAAVVKLLIENRPDERNEPEEPPKREIDSVAQQFVPAREPVIIEHPEEVGVNPNLMIEPMPPALVGALCAFRDIHLHPPREKTAPRLGPTTDDLAEEVEQALETDEDAKQAPAGLPLSSLLPNIWIKTGDRTVHIDIGAAVDLILSESLVLEVTDVLSNVRDLRGAWQSLSQIIAREMPRGGLEFGAPGLVGRIVRLGTRPFRKEAPALVRTMRWTMSLLGSPLQFVLQSGSTGVIVNFVDGDLAGVDLIEMDARRPLAAEWRRLSRDRRIGFVHFIFRLETMPGAGTGNWAWRNVELGEYDAPPSIVISPRRRLQYYPDNAIAAEIARHFLGLGMVNMLDLLPDLFDL